MKIAFNPKAMDRLKNTVGDWKEKWMYHGDAAKPPPSARRFGQT